MKITLHSVNLQSPPTPVEIDPEEIYGTRSMGCLYDIDFDLEKAGAKRIIIMNSGEAFNVTETREQIHLLIKKAIIDSTKESENENEI